MTLNEHIAAGPAWVFWWVNFLGIVNIAAVLFLLRWNDGRIRFGRIEAVFILLALAGSIVLIEVLFRQFGYSRILGLSHILMWTPLAIYIWKRLPRYPRSTPFGIYLRVLLATICASLVFDYVDFVRYLSGDAMIG